MRIIHKLDLALRDIVAAMALPWPEKAVLEPPKDPKHGDIAANLPMMLAREAGKNPRALAETIAARLRETLPEARTIEVAGPGFLNIVFHESVWHAIIPHIEAQGADYGKSALGAGKKVQVEYVSANPTGPLHVGHGRGAAVGDSLARILRFAGYDVTTEYYINDAGRQMRLLGLSVWLRAKELAGMEFDWPDDFYRGAYIIDIAKEIMAQEPYLRALPEDLGTARCGEFAAQRILDGIKADLADFRVEHQIWFSEQSLLDKGAVQATFDSLRTAGHTFEQDGALWFATTPLGDDKDRVLRKSDGSLTYFASDIAYHADKYQRGFDYVIDIWGADHHGYIPRMRAAIAALGCARTDFDVVLIQLVNLLENGVPIGMSTRAGTFETLADVVAEVGVDAARFMFLSRKSDSPLDFDLELVKQRTLDNPVYYVKYAHARICAIERRAEERGIALPPAHSALASLAPLITPEDVALLRMAARFEDTATAAARLLAPHHISHYLMDLAALLHSYYAKYQILAEEDMPTTWARLALLRAVGQVLRNGLDLLGVDAPDTM